MAIPLLLTILAILIPFAILRPFSRPQKMIMFTVIVLYVLMMYIGHWLVLRRWGGPIIRDTSVDAYEYYDETRGFEDYAPFSITKDDLIKASGMGVHLGYHYVLGTLTSMTPYPVLAVRILKVLVFFTGLACVMRVWRTDYGADWPIYGFLFLTVLYLLMLRHLFRNYRDGLLLGLFLIGMALLDTLLRPKWQRLLMSRTKLKTVIGWALLLALLWIISATRFYLAAIMAAAILMHLITASGLGVKMRFALVAMVAVVAVFVLRGEISETFGTMTRGRGLGTMFFGIRGLVHALCAPIPWQVARRWLTLSHISYLVLLAFAARAFFVHLRKNLTWHLYFTMILVYLLGATMAGSHDRKRMFIVPIFIMWVLSDLAYRRRTRIDQIQYQQSSEQYQSEEFSEYDEQIEYAEYDQQIEA